MLAALHPFGQIFKSTCQQALALVLPPSCIACHSHLPAAEPMGFCPTCYASLPWWNTSHIMKPDLPPALTSFAAPCLYEEPLRQTLLNLKFHDHTHLAHPLAKLFLPLVPPIPNLLIIPVPSHPQRLRQRLYNHAALLATQLSLLTHIPAHLTTLTRLVPSAPQNSKTRAQRLALPGTHFECGPQAQGRPILLIDDIFTTGATARACALALKRAGATQVHVLTLAYTRPE